MSNVCFFFWNTRDQLVFYFIILTIISTLLKSLLDFVGYPSQNWLASVEQQLRGLVANNQSNKLVKVDSIAAAREVESSSFITPKFIAGLIIVYFFENDFFFTSAQVPRFHSAHEFVIKVTWFMTFGCCWSLSSVFVKLGKLQSIYFFHLFFF